MVINFNGFNFLITCHINNFAEETYEDVGVVAVRGERLQTVYCQDELLLLYHSVKVLYVVLGIRLG